VISWEARDGTGNGGAEDPSLNARHAPLIRITPIDIPEPGDLLPEVCAT
jgi:hypothetical protein